MTVSNTGETSPTPRRRRKGYHMEIVTEIDDRTVNRALWKLIDRWIQEGRWEEVEHEDWIEVRPKARGGKDRTNG